MTRVIVTGGSGYVGCRFVARASRSQAPIQVTSIVRQPSGIEHRNVVQLRADLRQPEVYAHALQEADYIIWFAADRDHFAGLDRLIANNVEPLVKSLEVLRHSNRVKMLVYVSSISAADSYERSDVITDDTRSSPSSPYGKSKRMAECIVEQAAIPYLILRLPFMYGSGFPAFGHLWFWHKLVKIPASRRIDFSGELSLLHIDDLARFLLRLVGGDIYVGANAKLLINDGQRYRLNQLLDSIQKVLGIEQHFRARSIHSLLRYLDRAVPYKPFRYWARVLYDPNFFVAVPSQALGTDWFRYLDLAEGMAETYGG